MYHVKLAITKVKERKETTTTEPRSDANIPDPKEIREHMLLNLDEIGEDYRHLNAKVTSCSTNKTWTKYLEKAATCRFSWTSATLTATPKTKINEGGDVTEVRMSEGCLNCCTLAKAKTKEGTSEGRKASKER